MINFYNSKLSKLLSLVLIISFTNLLYLNCSNNESPTEPEQKNETNVDSNGSASISTDSNGKASIVSKTFDRIDFEIKASNNENLKDINISYHEDHEKCFIEVSDPTGKYAKFIFWGDPNDFNTSIPNTTGLAKVTAIQKTNVAITLVIVLVAAVASTVYASYSAYKAFKEIDEFWATDKIIDEFGEAANIKTMEQLMDYIKSKISATAAIITIGLNVVTLGAASAATLPAQGAIQATSAIIGLASGPLTDFGLAWYNDHKKEEWGEAYVNTKFIVREFSGEKQKDEDGHITFLGLDIQPYNNFQQPQFQKAEFSLPYPLSNLAKLTAYCDYNNVVYIFGGYQESYGWSNSILRMSPANNNIQALSTPLPFLNDGRFIVCNNPHSGLIYLFRLQDVYTFDPNTESFQKILSDSSPESIGDYSIAKFVSSNNSIYIFGNRGSGRGNFILKFDPDTNQFQKLNTNYSPTNNILTGVAYSNRSDAIYLFGGAFSTSYYNSIQKFNPQTHSISAIGAQIPISSGGNVSSYVMDKNKIYIFGGEVYSTDLKQIFEFDCSSEQILKLMDMPKSMCHTGAEYIPSLNRIYIFGGRTARSGGFIPATNNVYYLQL